MRILLLRIDRTMASKCFPQMRLKFASMLRSLSRPFRIAHCQDLIKWSNLAKARTIYSKSLSRSTISHLSTAFKMVEVFLSHHTNLSTHKKWEWAKLLDLILLQWLEKKNKEWISIFSKSIMCNLIQTQSGKISRLLVVEPPTNLLPRF